MSDYKRRNINMDKLSNHVRSAGKCTEEAALHLMDEIIFLRAESSGWKESVYQHNARVADLEEERDDLQEKIQRLENENQKFKEAEGSLLDEIIRLTSENATRDKSDTAKLCRMHYAEGKITGRVEAYEDCRDVCNLADAAHSEYEATFDEIVEVIARRLSAANKTA